MVKKIYCLRVLESGLIKFLNLLDDLKNCNNKGEMNDLSIYFDTLKADLIKILNEVEL